MAPLASHIGIWVARFVLGGLFVWGSLYKIADPIAFARMIHGYDLMPGAVINAMAIVMPYLELFAGLGLLFGILPRGSLLAITAMLGAFTLAIGINLARGVDMDCGCFGTGASWLTKPEVAFTRNLILLAMTAVLWRTVALWAPWSGALDGSAHHGASSVGGSGAPTSATSEGET